MKKLKFTLQLISLAAILCFSSCQRTAPDSPVDNQQVLDAIHEQYKRVSQAMQEGNTDKITAVYTENAVYYGPDGGVAIGRAAIQNEYRNMIDAGLQIECETNEVQANDGMAFEIGRADILNEAGEVVNAPKYMVIWKYEDGYWKIHRDFVQGNRKGTATTAEKMDL